MPTYNYSCLQCGKSMDIMHKISETADECPSCGAIKSLIKNITAPLGVKGGYMDTSVRVSKGVKQ